MAENPLKVIAILEILHFVVHQSKKGIKKYYEANPDALKFHLFAAKTSPFDYLTHSESIPAPLP